MANEIELEDVAWEHNPSLGVEAVEFASVTNLEQLKLVDVACHVAVVVVLEAELWALFDQSISGEEISHLEAEYQ
jgi:hypothetical protein